MVNRRKALLIISGAIFGGVARASSSIIRWFPSPQAGTGGAAVQPDAAGKAADDRLREDLARLDSRADSEEGVSVFLACVNLVDNKASHKPAAPALTALNAYVAGEFRETAAAWERIRPTTAGSDVAHVIEVLAVRDFANAGKEQQS